MKCLASFNFKIITNNKLIRVPYIIMWIQAIGKISFKATFFDLSEGRY